MRRFSMLASVAGHLALVGAMVGAPVHRRPEPPVYTVVTLPPLTREPSGSIPDRPRIPAAPQAAIDPATLPVLPELPILAPIAGRLEPVVIGRVLAVEPGGREGEAGPLELAAVDELPVLLVVPAPPYPELLRQAGAEGRVVLEAVVDTTGHVEPGSIEVRSATHVAFADAAARALAAALFRPARVHGRAVRVRVRVPIDFRIRAGRLPGGRAPGISSGCHRFVMMPTLAVAFTGVLFI